MDELPLSVLLYWEGMCMDFKTSMQKTDCIRKCSDWIDLMVDIEMRRLDPVEHLKKGHLMI
jgi:hypothetical protein